MELTKPSITRLARRAGVKSISNPCFDIIRKIIQYKTDEIIRVAMLINNEHLTKTLMAEDIYQALELTGVNLTQSTEISTSTCPK